MWCFVGAALDRLHGNHGRPEKPVFGFLKPHGAVLSSVRAPVFSSRGSGSVLSMFSVLGYYHGVMRIFDAIDGAS